jgi:PAS domain-containing protein
MRAAAGEATPPDGWATLFRSAFVDARNAMLLLDDRLRAVDVNGAYLRLVRRPRDDVIGWPVHRFLAHGAVRSEAAWSAALAAGRVTGEAEVLGGDASATSSGSSPPARPGRRSPTSCRSRTTPSARMSATR